jgi:hypothetical protein
MKLIKLAFGGALATCLIGLTGCGDDGGGGGGGVIEFPDPDCSGGVGSEPGVTYTMTALIAPDATDDPEPEVGFNLDDLVSPGGDDDIAGCTIADFGGEAGIDNGLAYLTGFLDTAANMDPANMNMGFNGALANGIAGEEIVITMTFNGWNGTADDSCITVDMDTGDFGDAVTGAEATVVDNVMYVFLPDFGLSLPLNSMAGAQADLTVHSGQMYLDFDDLSGQVGGIIDKGSETYTAASAMSLPEGTVHRTIYNVLTALMFEFPDALIDGALQGSSDINPSTGTPPCSAMSIGLEYTVEATP